MGRGGWWRRELKGIQAENIQNLENQRHGMACMARPMHLLFGLGAA